MFGFLFGLIGSLLDVALWLVLVAALFGAIWVAGNWVYLNIQTPDQKKTLKEAFLDVWAQILGLLKKLW